MSQADPVIFLQEVFGSPAPQHFSRECPVSSESHGNNLSGEQPVSRRAFARTAAGSAFLILKPASVWRYQANSAVRLALLGCGSRGTTVATSFAKNTSARVVALGDIFQDQLEKGKNTFDGIAASLGYPGPDPKLLFRGAHAYQELANSKDIDAIQISTPPFFHVEHLAAAVAGGKHAYCEKPVGVDVPQTERALEIAKHVGDKISVDVGFQIRRASPFVELVKRIRAGALGKLVSIDAHYYAPASSYPDRPSSMSKDELQLRNWQWSMNLSGDIFVEQAIHVVDICNWILDAHPTAVYATGARSVVSHFGDNFDNYQVNYTYPNDVHVNINTKQYGQTRDFDVSEKVFGALGYAESPYSGPLRIVGENAWEWKNPEHQPAGTASGFAQNGAFSDNLADADKEKDRSFIESITSGKHHNQIELGVATARTAIMARMSAHRGHAITWNDLLTDKERFKLDFDLKQFS
jgi:myo-inositol 2-dehydrogenase / D-chiro-inositol 1-dehydrogenase